MVFPGEPPRGVEVMTAPAAASPSSHHSPQPHRSTALRVKRRSRLPQPPFRAWDDHRLLRCVGGAGAGGGLPPTPAAASTASPSAPCPGRRPAGPRDDGFERIRAKLMDHLREAAGRIELPPVTHGDARRKEPATGALVGRDADEDVGGGDNSANHASAAPAAAAPAPPAASGEELPWNLRTRRSAAASNAPQHNRGHASSTPLDPSRPRYGAPERREAAPRRRRPRFSVPLTKEEIDEDLYAFTGRRAPRRPKKRPRALQKHLDVRLPTTNFSMVFPGLWLSEVTVETYQVADPPPPPPPS